MYAKLWTAIMQIILFTSPCENSTVLPQLYNVKWGESFQVKSPLKLELCQKIISASYHDNVFSNIAVTC